ncbi:hypothetical protein ACFQ21_12780 [Ohtaekwangia kribbensis]|uniref:Uncharacterized protein n=1 Tax=Ohtaekwangia kribbensis TaxID=688913 RepID=A0ABW3K1W5_9BACT
MPYASDPQKTIAQFHEWIRKNYILDLRDNLYPELDEFIQWYCDSNTIRNETKKERKNIKALGFSQ